MKDSVQTPSSSRRFNWASIMASHRSSSSNSADCEAVLIASLTSRRFSKAAVALCLAENQASPLNRAFRCFDSLPTMSHRRLPLPDGRRYDGRNSDRQIRASSFDEQPIERSRLVSSPLRANAEIAGSALKSRPQTLGSEWIGCWMRPRQRVVRERSRPSDPHEP